MARPANVSELIPEGVDVIRCEPEWTGSGHRIPDAVSAQIPEVDVAINFGMDHLLNPEEIPATHGVLAYRHGDPEKRRGNPAGFYELKAGEHVMGVIVQRLATAPDGGEVLAKGYSRVIATSYRRTLDEAYAVGAPLLAKALTAAKSGCSLPLEHFDPSHSLPSNREVLSAVRGMASAFIGRLVYGALCEKRWKVAFVPKSFDPENVVIPAAEEFGTISVPEGYSFAADPAGESQGTLFCEVLNARTGKGQIAIFDGKTWLPVDLPVAGGHLSYPQIVKHAGVTYLFPEMAQVGPPTLFELDEETFRFEATHPLRGLETERLIDGTLFEHEEHWYLFAGRPASGNVRLDLWVADDLTGPWRQHPFSPICLDPRNARMAGPIVRKDGRIYRLGQDGSVGYGQGIVVSRVEELTPTTYSEVVVGPFCLQDVTGPHTVLPTGNGYWLDYYTEKWTPLAGVRRLTALVK